MASSFSICYANNSYFLSKTSQWCIKKEILDKASNSPPEDEIEKNIREIKEEFKSLCQESDLPDLSEDLESLLTYILFPNIALIFFKGRNF